MADYIFIRKSRNALSSFLHVVLNILLGVGSIFITVVSGSWIFGIILVFLSKWRIFAVRPRYWFLNIKSNLVDIIVGVSLVMLAYYSGTSFVPVQAVLAVVYVVWLIFIKPLSSETGTIIQALMAVFLGSTAAVLAASTIDSIVLVALEFVIGYGACRHVFAQNSGENYSLLLLVCGLLFAETAWLSQTWTIVYTFSETGIIIPQLAIILTIAAFSLAKVIQKVIQNDGAIKNSHILAPALFGIITIAIIVFGFSNPIFNI